jgi:uncharacterized membrane protein YphA (DoxX/SURF4 family)
MRGIGKLALRATIGGYFFGHGMQKLAGWFGGHRPEGTAARVATRSTRSSGSACAARS